MSVHGRAAPAARSLNWVWDVGTLAWVMMTQPGGGGGGGGDASAANQVLGNASLTSIDTKLTSQATAARQDTGNTSLSSIDTKTPALGQQLAAASSPVVLTAAQITTLTPPAAITGYALEAGHLAAIDTSVAKIPSQGQALAAASLPVVLTAAQITTLTPPAAITNFALEATQGAGNVLIGAVNETAPASDTANSGLNGRLQRVAQRLTSLIALLPAALVGGRLSSDIGGLNGTNIDTNSGLKSAGTMRVVLATDQPALTNKLLVTPDSVALPANQSCNVAQFGGTNVVTGTGAGGAGIPRVTVSNDSNVIVTPPTLTKGTQGATGFSTQDLHDAGRNQTNYFMAASVAGTNAEVMQSLTGYKGGIAVAATATPAVVTAGKTYRVTRITLSYQSLVTVGGIYVRIRANLTGAGVVGSPLVVTYYIGCSAAVAGVTTTEVIAIPEGLEFAAGTGIAVGFLGITTANTAGASGFGTIAIEGYEY